jgi:CheY-like chemotaxis protein
MTPREMYLQAKVEHYARKASELVKMGRYPVARKTVDSILELDPQNAEASNLRTHIDSTLADFVDRHRGNGHNGNGHNGNGHNGNGHNGNGHNGNGHDGNGHDGNGHDGNGHDGNGQNGNSRNGNRLTKAELVLCVDQDERVLVGLGATLKRHGYQWIGAASYDEATDLLTTVCPDVVISEVNFAAGSRGLDLFLWLRSTPALKNIPFLFHATRIDQEILIAGKRFGVDDFIMKPADGEVVAAAVTQTLQRKKSANATAQGAESELQ